MKEPDENLKMRCLAKIRAVGDKLESVSRSLRQNGSRIV